MKLNRYIIIFILFLVFLLAFDNSDGVKPAIQEEESVTALVTTVTASCVDRCDIITPWKPVVKLVDDDAAIVTPVWRYFQNAIIKYLYLNGNYLSKLRTFEIKNRGTRSCGCQSVLYPLIIPITG